jgi:hypothetical protein
MSFETCQAGAEPLTYKISEMVPPGLEDTLGPTLEQLKAGPPFETGYGMWAKYGPAPSAKEIDENRREMFHNFAKDF